MDGLRRTVGLTLLVAALVAGGCGGGDDKGADAGAGGKDRLAAAAGKAGSIESFKADFTANSKGQTGFRMEGTILGAGDNSKSRTTGTYMPADGRPFDLEVLQFGDEQFSRTENAELPEGKKWTRTQDTTGQVPITDFFKFLKASDGFEQVGTETIRGRETQHFKGPLDIEKLAELAGEDSAVAQQGAAGLDMIFEVWIDDEALPARMRLAMNDAEGDVGLDFLVDILEYGVALDFERPDDSEVAEQAG